MTTCNLAKHGSRWKTMIQTEDDEWLLGEWENREEGANTTWITPFEYRCYLRWIQQELIRRELL